MADVNDNTKNFIDQLSQGKNDEAGELSGLMGKRIKVLQTAQAKYEQLDKILKTEFA